MKLRISLQDSWVAQLYEKFRNERRRLTEDPEVVHQRKKRIASPDIPKIPKKMQRGELNWDPHFPEGEDEASMKQHKEFLKTEWKRRTKDEDKISQRMLVTFPDRRRMVNEVKSIKEIRDEYPAFFLRVGGI